MAMMSEYLNLFVLLRGHWWPLFCKLTEWWWPVAKQECCTVSPRSDGRVSRPFMVVI